MERKRGQLATLSLGALALLCWIVMFLAGTDVWHDVGRPDLAALGASNHDLRAFASAFYLLLIVLLIQLVATGLGFMTARPRPEG